MTTNNPYANITDLGVPRVCEHLPTPLISRRDNPQVSEFVDGEWVRVRIAGDEVVDVVLDTDEEPRS